MAESNAGPSNFNWLGAVWEGSEKRGEVTLESQLTDAKSLSLETQLQALLGSSNEMFHAPNLGFLTSGECTINWLIAYMGPIAASTSKTAAGKVSVLNSTIGSFQQKQSLNTQTAGQGVQMETNQVTQVDTMNQTNVVQLLSALVGQMNQWSGFQLN